MRQRAKINIKKLAVVGIILVIVLYIAFIVIDLIRKPTDTFLVEYGNLSLEENVEGYIIRDEQVIQSEESKDGIKQIRNEGEKVAKNDNVFRYYSSGEEELTKKISELDTKIGESLQNENNVFSSDIKVLDTQIESELQIIKGINNISEINKRKEKINSLINTKAKISGDLSPSGSYIKNLIEQRSSLENQLNSNSKYVKAPISGIVSYKIDGLEEVLTKNGFSNLNESVLEKLNLKTGQMNPTSQQKAKILNNFEAYIATVMSSVQAKEAEVGNNVKLRLNDIGEINAVIEYKTEETDGKVILVFKINNKVEQLTGYRKISFDVIWWNHKGLKAPNSALLIEEEQTYIIRTRAGYLDKILVKVLKQNEDYSIITNYTTDELKELGYSTDELRTIRTVSIYDEIIDKPKADMIK